MESETSFVPEVTENIAMDSAEKRLNELGYKQELRREMTMFKTLAISFSTMTLFTGITPLYGSSLQYAGPASLVWGWVVVCFFTWFVGIAMAEICSSFPTTGSLYFWAAHLAGSQTLQSIILLSTGTNKGGGYFAPKWLFLCMYIGLTVIWAALNTFALEVIAFIDIISIWWQVIGGAVIVIMLPLVALTTQSASYVFTNFELAPNTTGISSKPYAVILSFLVSQYSLYGYDAAAHLTEETKGADKNGPIAILGSLAIISDFAYLYDPNNETAGAFVPAQILYDAFHGRYHNSAGAIHKVPTNAVWLCAAICILLGLPILKVNVVFTAITSICTIGWVGGYAVPIFARMVMPEKNFKAGPFYLGKARRPICLVAFLWICYTCSVFLLPTLYPITWDTFNYAPVALGVGLGLIMVWWVLDARKWFKGPVRNINAQNGKV
ncbi:hypothetical protein RYX36_014141 [Vicia faba]